MWNSADSAFIMTTFKTKCYYFHSRQSFYHLSGLLWCYIWDQWIRRFMLKNYFYLDGLNVSQHLLCPVLMQLYSNLDMIFNHLRMISRCYRFGQVTERHLVKIYCYFTPSLWNSVQYLYLRHRVPPFERDNKSLFSSKYS